jgi:hypothetical protein
MSQLEEFFSLDKNSHEIEYVVLGLNRGSKELEDEVHAFSSNGASGRNLRSEKYLYLWKKLKDPKKVLVTNLFSFATKDLKGLQKSYTHVALALDAEQKLGLLIRFPNLKKIYILGKSTQKYYDQHIRYGLKHIETQTLPHPNPQAWFKLPKNYLEGVSL